MLNQNVLVFDIETTAATDAFRLVNNISQDISEHEVIERMKNERQSEVGNEFFRHHFHKVTCISCLLLQCPKMADPQIKLWTLGRNESEKDILTRFFAGIDKLMPVLVSWNGSGFDLPVLHYRALAHGISAPRYFENGDRDRSFNFNNYLSRYHWRHLDLMDIISAYQQKSSASLNDISRICGLPGKLDTDGGKVQEMADAGKISEICDYCETDVLNTYGIYLRFELLRGNIDEAQYNWLIMQLRNYLINNIADGKNEHFSQFLQAWDNKTSVLKSLQSNHIA